MARTGKAHDFAVIARNVVEKAIGEHLDGSPLPVQPPRDQKAVMRGKIGGAVGGPARAAKLTSEQRTAIAVRAATARWSKPVKKER